MTRRIGDEDDLLAHSAKRLQRRHGLGKGRVAVMDTAPKVAKQRIVGRGNVGKAFDDTGHGGSFVG